MIREPRSPRRDGPLGPDRAKVGHEQIRIRGAREHNLKNVDLDLPRDRLVVITGLSGSGKSSLAFDTVYAEGQRRYVESLSAYARQFLELMQKPDVEFDRGPVAGDLDRAEDDVAQPALDGRHGHRDLRLHAAAVRPGRGALLAGHRPADREPDRVADGRSVKAMAEGTRLYLMAPIVRGRKGEYRKELQDCRRRVSSGSRSTASCTRSTRRRRSTKNIAHDIDVVVDRIVVGARSRQPAGRIRSRPRSASPRASRSRKTPTPASGDDLFGEVRLSGVGLHDPGDRAPAVLVQRAVRRLPGLRRARHEDVLRSRDGGAGPRAQRSPTARSPVGAFVGPYYMQTLESIGQAFQAEMSTPWRDLPEKMRQTILYGSAANRSASTYDDGRRNTRPSSRSRA